MFRLSYNPYKVLTFLRGWMKKSEVIQHRHSVLLILWQSLLHKTTTTICTCDQGGAVKAKKSISFVFFLFCPKLTVFVCFCLFWFFHL